MESCHCDDTAGVVVAVMGGGERRRKKGGGAEGSGVMKGAVRRCRE